MKGDSQDIAAVVLTYNERERIGNCLTSLTWADEMVVVDSGSEDGTAELAVDLGAAVLKRDFVNFADQRNFALESVEAAWVLFVDADEQVTPELATEIRDRVGTEGHVGYWLPRRNRILGGWLQATGWHPDRQLRLLRRGDARYVDDRPVHETVKLDGSAGIMKAELLHEGLPTVGEFRRKQRLYLPLAAEGLRLRGVRAGIHSPLVQAWREFRHRLVTLRGYRDGWRGIVLSVLMAEHEFRVYRRLRATSSGSE